MKRFFLALVENKKIKRMARTVVTVYENNEEILEFDVPQFTNRGEISEMISRLVEMKKLDESFMDGSYAATKAYNELLIRFVYGTNLRTSNVGRL
jgi:hypothetical protein